MKIESLQVGQVLYDLRRHRMGNTSMTTWGVWTARVISIADDYSSFEASWNGNRSQNYRAVPKSWKAKAPVMIRDGMRSRPATREEIKSMKGGAP